MLALGRIAGARSERTSCRWRCDWPRARAGRRRGRRVAVARARAVPGLRRQRAVRRPAARATGRRRSRGSWSRPASCATAGRSASRSWRSGAARRLKAGEYRFDRPMTAAEVVAMLARGDVYLRPVTFPEGLTIREMARIFESRGLGTADSFVEAAREGASLVRDIDPSARDLEGYLFPETYALSRHAGAAELVRMMAARFHQVFTPELREAAAARGLSPREAVTLASTRREGDRAAGRAADRRRRLPPSAAPEHGAAVRPDRHLRARGEGPVPRQPDAREPAGRFALQHLPLPGAAARADRRAEPRRRSRPSRTPSRWTTCTSSAATTARTSSPRTLDEHNRNVRKYQVEYFRQRRASSPHH